MAKNIQTIRGMHDVLPSESPAWQKLETQLRQLVHSYGYDEIRTPVMESTELFCRSIGDVTDIVEKEMYTFDDRNGDSLSLRPEGTASTVRAGVQHGLLYNQIQRLWYMGKMYRHERPQKGRYREFQQFGVETYGMPGPDADAELIMMSAKLWDSLDIKVRLEINTLGTPEERAEYRAQLISYYEGHIDVLGEEEKSRLHSNPLRILDSKNPAVQAVNQNAPSLMSYLGDESQQHFETLKSYLDSAGIAYEVNTHLVRGLDYYCHTVFEWITEELGAQGTICAGGRYDGLVAQLGGQATPAVGFAMGMERILALLEEKEAWMPVQQKDVYVIGLDASDQADAFATAEKLRSARPDLAVTVHCGGGSVKSKFKKADKTQSQIALIVGGEEQQRGELVVKPLRGGEQQTIPHDALLTTLNELIG